MKTGSYLINLSRGPIIEDKNLILENLLSKNLKDMEQTYGLKNLLKKMIHFILIGKKIEKILREE